MIRVHQLAPSVLEQIDVEIASPEHAIAPRRRAFLFLLALLRLPDLVNVDVARTAVDVCPRAVLVRRREGDLALVPIDEDASRATLNVEFVRRQQRGVRAVRDRATHDAVFEG